MLTVLIPAKNERLNIRPCIESARAIADEILVADSGSSDGTLDIVRQLGCRIIERELINFSDFKNWAIPQAKHPWVLVLDADERVTPELADEVRLTIANPPEELDGYWIGRENYFMGHRIRHCGWNSDAVFRLFRRDVCRYTNRRVHEAVNVARGRDGRLKGKLRHYTVWNYDRYLAKMAHYTRLGAMDLHDRGRRASFAALSLPRAAPIPATVSLPPRLSRRPRRIADLYAHLLHRIPETSPAVGDRLRPETTRPRGGPAAKGGLAT